MWGIDDNSCFSEVDLQTSVTDWELISCNTFQFCIKINPTVMIHHLYEVGKKMETLLTIEFDNYSLPKDETLIPLDKWFSLFNILQQTNSVSTCGCSSPCIKNIYLVLELFETSIEQWEKTIFRYNSHKTDEEYNRTLHNQHKEWEAQTRFYHVRYKSSLPSTAEDVCLSKEQNPTRRYLKSRLPHSELPNISLCIATFDEEYDVHPSPAKIRRVTTLASWQMPTYDGTTDVITSIEQDKDLTNMEKGSFYDDNESSNHSLDPLLESPFPYSVAGYSNVEAGPSYNAAGRYHAVPDYFLNRTGPYRIFSRRESSSSLSSLRSRLSLPEETELDFEEDTYGSEKRQTISNRNYKFNFFYRMVQIDKKLYNYILYNEEIYNTMKDS